MNDRNPHDPCLRVEAATFMIGSTTLLHDIDFTAHGGELVALVGPNGAGKSTFLSLVAGDQQPTSGRVLLDGRAVAYWPARQLAQRRAVMTQHHEQAFAFTVREVVGMGRAPYPVGDDEPLIEQCMQQVAVDGLAQRDVTTLSGGELARTVFARVLAQTTQVVLLDEPTAALDLRHQEAIMACALRLARQGSLVLVVLHDLSLAARYSDRVVVFHHGRLYAEGTPHDVLTPSLVRQVYHHDVVVINHPVTGRPLVVPL